jgi:tetratricopeptide (TPR) repeat protein
VTEPHTTPYLCATCGASFQLDAEAKERCPSCLRTSGLVRQDHSSSDTSGGWGPTQYALVALLAVGAMGLAYVLGAKAPEPLASQTAKLSAPKASLDTVPEALRLNTQAVDGAVRLAAEPLERSSHGVLAAVRSAVSSGVLPERDRDGAMDGAPRTAGELAVALSGVQAPEAGSLEQATLLGALLDARGLGPVTYGVDDGATDAATDIARRRYLVKAGDGEWLTVDEGPAPTSARTLSEVELLANQLAWRSLADLASQDLTGASKASQTARSLAPTDAAILFVAGQVQVLSGLAEPGIATMERAAGIASDSRTWFALGVMSAEANQPFKARQYLLRAAEGSAHADPHLLLAQLALERLATTPKEGHGPLIEEAKGHIGRAEATDPKAPGLTTMKAQMAALAGDIEGAEAILRADTAARPTDEESWLTLFQFLLETEREREAMETLQTGIDAGAKGAGLHHVLGMLLAQDERPTEAIASLTRALEIEPKRSNGLRIQLAQLVRAEGDEARAISLLQEEITLAGGERRHARLLLAQMHLDSERTGAAKPLVDAVLAETPDDQEARLVAYLIALKAGQGAEAEKSAALAAIGQRSGVARVLLEQGFIEDGEALLREAIVEEPDDALAPVLLGALLLGTGRGEEAHTLRDKVLESTAEGAQRDRLKQLFETAFGQANQELERLRSQPTPTTPEAEARPEPPSSP